MASSPYCQRFDQFVPDQYLRQLLRCLGDAYASSRDRAQQEFGPSERAMFRGVLRRQLIEKNMRLIAEPFPELISSAERDINGAWSHSLIIASGKVALSHKKVPNPDHVARPCNFRGQYAQSNQAVFPFASYLVDEATAAENELLYGIVLHGRELHSNRLGFAVVRFLLPDQSGYFDGKIDLFGRFPDIAALISSAQAGYAPEEEIDDDFDIDLNEGEDIG